MQTRTGPRSSSASEAHRAPFFRGGARLLEAKSLGGSVGRFALVAKAAKSLGGPVGRFASVAKSAKPLWDAVGRFASAASVAKSAKPLGGP
eukprot:3383806-Alexandrium_andersonii.AAC.1